MALVSLQYALFCGAVFAAFLLAPPAHRWRVLLAASLAAGALTGAWGHLLLLGVTVLLAWVGARRLAGPRSDRRRALEKWAFAAALLGVLVAGRLLPAPRDAAGAIGLSYAVFQALAALFDADLGVAAAEPSLGRVALSLTFFPKVAQGPIERPGGLLAQLREPLRFDYARTRSGLVLFCWGLFQKAVVADRLALPVQAVYGAPAAHSGLEVLVATWLFAFQLYLDFAGYTDMARGAARVLGLELAENFASPYTATSVAEFWRRWHVSFSRWLLDYVFRPLQLRWRALGRHASALALLVTFGASGLWHGVRPTYLAWGLLHGLLLAGTVYTQPWRARIDRRLGPGAAPALRALRVLLTFHLVCLGWVFFRAATLGDAATLLSRLAASGAGELLRGGLRAAVQRLLPALTPLDAVIVLGGLATLPLARRLRRLDLGAVPLPLRWAGYGALFLAVAALGRWGGQTFIYFEF